MVATVVAVELHLPGVRSLKQKRRIVKSLKDRIRHRFQVSVAETGHLDLHQRAELGIAAVAGSGGPLAERFDAIRRTIESRHDLVVTRWDEVPVEVGP